MQALKVVMFIAGLSGCPVPQTKDLTGTWGPQDEKILASAQQRCIEHFPNSPCLKLLIKKAQGNYYAICGQKH